MADENTQRSPYTRPGFIAAAVLVLLLVVAAVVVIVNGTNSSNNADDGTDTAPIPTETETPEPEATGGESICGLDEVEMEGTLDTPPEASWVYLDHVAFPASESAGPGNDDPSDVLNCFARTPEGAVLAATVGMGQLSSVENREGWAESNMVDGPARDEVLTVPAEGVEDGAAAVRVTISGFRLQSYDGDTARVDVAMTGEGSGRSVYYSQIIPMKWEDGDWKMAFEGSDVREPTQLPNLSGYKVWPE